MNCTSLCYKHHTFYSECKSFSFIWISKYWEWLILKLCDLPNPNFIMFLFIGDIMQVYYLMDIFLNNHPT